MNDPVHARGLPPWIQPDMQRHIAWRDGDIVIAVPPKSGTTWTMNIVHQLLSGGDPDFVDIYGVVPWIEFVTHPGMAVEELLERLERMPADRPRAFKTHSLPSLFASARGTNVRYLVVMRNPEEALVSMKPFIEQHSDEWIALWGMPRAAITYADFSSFYREMMAPRGMDRALFEFLRDWWPLRERPDVLLLHYRDMTRDHERAIRCIADFLGMRPEAAQWAKILEYTSFSWMKRHGTKFDALTAAPIPPLKPGAMVRKGSTGAAREDGMTDEIAAEVRALGREICPDEQALRWFYEGGWL
jgi:hypothetical protein